MSRGRLRGLVLGLFVLVGLVAFDQWSKGAVFDWLEAGAHEVEFEIDDHGHRRYPIVGEWFTFMTSCNRGAAFGQFGDYPGVLLAGRLFAVALLGFLLLRTDPRERLVFWAMVLVLSGALGNVVDNLWTGCEGSMPHGVRDFIDVYFGPLGWDKHFPSFNVADSCITVGAVLWILSGFFHRPSDAATPAEG